jgi:hypothetical protein
LTEKVREILKTKHVWHGMPKETQNGAGTATAGEARNGGSASREGRGSGNGHGANEPGMEIFAEGRNSEQDLENRLVGYLSGTGVSGGKKEKDRDEGKDRSNDREEGERRERRGPGTLDEAEQEAGEEGNRSRKKGDRNEREERSEREEGEDDRNEDRRESDEREERSEEQSERDADEGEREERAEERSEREDDEEDNQDWPSSARKVTKKLRSDRRQLRDRVAELEEELESTRGELESEELKRPVQVQGGGEGPLSFVKSEKELTEWSRNAKKRIRIVEDYLDGTLTAEGERELKAWAQTNKIVGPGEELDKASLKEFKRWAEEQLDYAPDRIGQFKEEAGMVALAERLFPDVWGKKGSRGHKDALYVLKNVPQLRSLPNWKLLASVLAMGWPQFQERLDKLKAGKSDGRDSRDSRDNRSSGSRIAGEGDRNRGRVGSPGRSALLPRRDVDAGGKSEREQLRKKAFTKESSMGDVEKFLEAELLAGGLVGRR